MADRQATVEHIRATSAEINSFISKLDGILFKNLSKIMNGLFKKDPNANEVAQVLGQLQDVLLKAGLSEQIQNLRGIYGDQLRFISTQFPDSKSIFTNLDKNSVEALVNFDLTSTSHIIEGYLDDVRSQVMSSTLIGETPDFNQIHEQVGGRLASNLETELNTNLASFQRTVTITKGRDLGFTKFEYVGPDDKVIRPFCKKLLKDKQPPIYAVSEISKMDNGQGLSVLTFGGGYNCRHNWRPVE